MTSDNEADINDVFESILFSDENSVEQGYTQGFQEGKNEGSSEGFHFGYHRGAELGAKIGYYLGFIEYHQQNTEHIEKNKKSLQDLKLIIESFPQTNVDDVDIVKQIDNISAQFRKLCDLIMRAEMILRVKAHLEALTAHLNQFKEIIDCHMVNFLLHNHWKSFIPTNIQTEIRNEADIETAINVFFNELNQLSEFPSNKLCAFQDFISTNRSMTMESLIPQINLSANELMSELGKLGCASSPEENLRIHEFCSPKKNHEVEIVSEVIAKLSSYKNQTGSNRMLVIDVGDGKGYLSSRLALQHKMKVLGVDGNVVNTEGAAKRSAKLGKAWHGLTRRAKNQKLGLNKLETSSDVNFTNEMAKLSIVESLYRTTTLMIDSSTDLLALVRNNFPEHMSSEFALTGLHTCGNLSPNSLTIFLNNERLKVICNVGCCYHLLRERFVEDTFFNQNKLEDNCQDYGFPMSQYLIQKKFALGRNARMLASQSIHRVVANKEIPNGNLAFRALLEIILRQHSTGVSESRQVGKIKCEHFEDYIHKSLAKLGIDMHLPDLNKLLRAYEHDCKLLNVFYFLRLSFASVIETTILLDKYLYLLENNVDHAFIVKLFSPVLSPRCYGIVALK